MAMANQITLDEWCDRDGRPMEELAKAFGMSRVHLWRIRKGGTKELDVAERIERVTRGEVTAISLLGLDRRKKRAGVR
jgi:transcriptional regulator with XRE-family HTH domain